jgi:hypothetical protein
MTIDLPERVVVGANGAYWRDYADHYSMCPVSDDNDPIEPVAIYIRAALAALPAPRLDVDALAGALFYVYGNVTRTGPSIGPDRPGPRTGFRPRPFWEEDARLVVEKYAELAGLIETSGQPREVRNPENPTIFEGTVG